MKIALIGYGKMGHMIEDYDKAFEKYFSSQG